MMNIFNVYQGFISLFVHIKYKTITWIMNYIKSVNILAVFCLCVVSFSGLIYMQGFVVAVFRIVHLLSAQLLCHYFYSHLATFLLMEKSVTFTDACANEIISNVNKTKEGGQVRIKDNQELDKCVAIWFLFHFLWK
jgi:hypothetical protein